MFIDFREREKDKNIYVTETLIVAFCTCTIQKSNLQSFGAWDDAPTNSPTRPGSGLFYFAPTTPVKLLFPWDIWNRNTEVRTDNVLVDFLLVLQLLGLLCKVYNPHQNLLDFRVVIHPLTEFYITLPVGCRQQPEIKHGIYLVKTWIFTVSGIKRL